LIGIVKSLYFSGIGGAGMAPLARIALARGCRVAGSDKELNAKTDELLRMGAVIHAGHDAAHIPEDCDLLVYSSAIPEDNPERVAARLRHIPEMRRGAFLAEIAKDYPVSIAVSGSHGKTSTTAMLVWILQKTGRKPGYLVGGSVDHLHSGEAGDGSIFVTEADESDGTHVLLHPTIGIIPNIEDDHAWSVGGREQLFENFRTFAGNCGRVIVPQDTAESFFHTTGLDLDVPGPAGFCGFMKTDALLAAAGAEALGISREEAFAALADFPGVQRRMTIRLQTDDLTIIEDYAHHPTEVAAAITFLRERYPGKHLHLLFQPHRYARLAQYFDRFAEELQKADSVTVAPVFAAWTESGELGSAELAQAIGPRATAPSGSWEEIARQVQAELPKSAVLAVLGAGDVEKVFQYLV
jgi:UDP-N-acetylmuramate--alanine ligase